MANIIRPKAWSSSALKPVDEKVYLHRRQFLRQLGLATLGAATLPQVIAQGWKGTTNDAPAFHFSGEENYYPAPLNERYGVKRAISAEASVTQRNNFVEFINPGDANIYNAHKHVQDFDTSNWKVEIAGKAYRTGTLDLGELIADMGTEERMYRFRCVERWSMVVPWTGFSLAKLLEYCQPKSGARYVKFYAAANKEQMPGMRYQHWYGWPYTEGLRIEEAKNELAFLATGIYGKPLPKQSGAPIRLVVPWQYGYKSIKSITKIEFTKEKPATFWGTLSPLEYPFESVIDPKVAHPRWSQEFEWDIATGEQIPTMRYNGYGEFVAGLY